ncbi:MAG: LPS export ABC transporter periplasmic protein LptC [Bacteriovoracaceae bacterium]|nr:LPS export ABC transporter periplasmic protein LptC [Bacteriovoracaceae bacterium]
MILRPYKSTMVIVFFLSVNTLVWWGAWSHRRDENWGEDSKAILSEVPNEMTELEYFHLDHGRAAMSLSADSMQSIGEEVASFIRPRGTYAPDKKQSAVTYQAMSAEYVKARDSLKMLGEVKIDHEASHYQADQVTYYPKKDLMTGKGHIVIDYTFQKSQQKIHMTSNSMKAKPKQDWAKLVGNVESVTTPKFKHQEGLNMKANEMELQGLNAQVSLKESVYFKRGGMIVTARNGEIFLEQTNKKLKYFILNDDVKVTETLMDANGMPLKRNASAERLEGFGQDKVVLSGAPRVVQGKDTIKGYRITMREKMEFIEVEDAMSDVQVEKKDENKKAKER